MFAAYFGKISDSIDTYKDKFPQLEVLKYDFDALKERYGRVVRKIASINPMTKAATELLLEPESMETRKNQLLTKLTANKISVIVILDEIDRLSDEEIRGIIQVIKALSDFPNFSYLLAYDPDRVAKALGGADLKFGHSYLEKIVQVQTRLPRISDERMKHFIKGQFQDYPDTDLVLGEILERVVPEILYTPRDARRFAAAFAARKAVLEEVEIRDLLLYCALESRIPVLSERLQKLATRVSMDGSRELERQTDELLSREKCVERILDVFKDDDALRRLLLHLFPALEEGGRDEAVRDDGRLCYETSLLSLLNYGKVPNAISIEEARHALEEPRERVPELLGNAVKLGCVRQANLRMRTIAKEIGLRGKKAKELWLAIAEFFDRPIESDEMASWTPWVEVSHVWVRAALLNYLKHHPLEEDAGAFVEELIDKGVFHLTAHILHFHAQAYGLFGLERRPNLQPRLSEEQVSYIAVLSVKRFAELIIGDSETKTWRLRSCIPLWITMTDHWDGGYNEYWNMVQKHLSNPNTRHIVDAVAVLLLRTRHEMLIPRRQGGGYPLVKLLNVKSIVDSWRQSKDSTEELRKPVELAYQYLHAQKG